MDELNGWGYRQTTDQTRKFFARTIVDQIWGQIRLQLVYVVEFLSEQVPPTTLNKFELALMFVVREIG